MTTDSNKSNTQAATDKARGAADGAQNQGGGVINSATETAKSVANSAADTANQAGGSSPLSRWDVLRVLTRDLVIADYVKGNTGGSTSHSSTT